MNTTTTNLADNVFDLLLQIPWMDAFDIGKSAEQQKHVSTFFDAMHTLCCDRVLFETDLLTAPPRLLFIPADRDEAFEVFQFAQDLPHVALALSNFLRDAALDRLQT